MSVAIDWPWEYNFPPFFTIQVNEDTLKHQLSVWRSLVTNYAKANKICILDVRETRQTPLFKNAAINRSLSEDGILVVLKDLARTGHAESVDKSQTQWYVFWEPLEQLAASVHKWIISKGMTGSVCTFFELTQGDSTTNENFFGLSDEVLAKALQKLELQNKAEIMDFDGDRGVKFF